MTALVARRADQMGRSMAVFECKANVMGHPLYLDPRRAEAPVWLELELETLSGGYAGLLVGANVSKSTRLKKLRAIRKALAQRIDLPLLVAVADPGLEAWMLADPRALGRAVLPDTVKESPVPTPVKRPRSRKQARRLLSEWVGDLLGARPLRGGLEYASRVGALIEEERIEVGQHPDLMGLIREIPGFVEQCISSASSDA